MDSELQKDETETSSKVSARLVKWQRASLPSALFGSRCYLTDTFPNVKNTLFGI